MRKLFMKSHKGATTRNIMNVSAITIIAALAITWIGIMEINKKN